jgi:hypothetical protein
VSGEARRVPIALPRRLISHIAHSALLVSILAGPTESARAAGQLGTPTNASRSAVVERANSSIVVDGVLDEAIWNITPQIGDLVQREPRPGAPPTEKTEVRLLFDASSLYIGVICYDSEPERVIGTQMARDASLDDDDRIQILLDTFHDRRNAFYFATNPSGALVDGLIIENGNLNREWDAIWNVRAKRTGQGWTAEFAIPFKSLSFRSGQTSWGFNVSRTIKRKIEEDRWSGARLELGFFQVSEAGEITGLQEVRQGIGLDVRPFAAGRWLHRAATGDNTLTGKPGLDAFYNITSSLKLSATFHTDFGETEVDARQINLTRFPLFFPEKRSFFLENAGVFSFSNTGSDVLPFFSRRIGLLAGQEVPILFGAKLTGKAGRTDVGLLEVRTRDSSAATAKNFFVSRVKQNLLRQSYVGAIFTHGDPALPSASNTFGTDLRLATSRFLGHAKNFVFDAFGLKSTNEGVHGKDWAYGFSAEYPNDLLSLEFSWREVQQNFRPALGFVPRPNVRRLFVGGEYDPRPRDFLNVRQMFHEVFYTRFTRLDNGQVESWRFFTAPINWRFNSGDRAEFNWVPSYEQLFAPFEISDGVILPPGEYHFTRWRLEAYSASKRRLEARVTWWFGTYWSGHADEIATFLQYKIPPRFVVNFSTSQTFARLPQGSFVARVLSWRVNYAFSPFLVVSNLIQYDNNSRNLGWQSRLRWILTPGNDLFLVFGQSWLQDANGGFRFRAGESKLSAKFQYTFRF